MADISATFVDDTSPLIVYSNNWQTTDNVPASLETFNNTVTFSSTAGSTATFNFTGTVVAVQVLALFKNTPPVAKFVLDDSTPSVWQAAPSDNGTIVAAFQSTTLSNDPHSLQIIVGLDNAPVFLDAIGVASKGSVASTGAGVSQTSIPVSPTSSSTVGTSSGSKVPVGAIVGGVIGGVALLLAIFLALYFLCWRRRNKRPYYYSNASPEELLAGEAKQVTPFPPPASQQPSSVNLAPPSAYSDSNAPLITPPASSYGGQNVAYAPSGVGGSTEYSSSSGMTRSTTVLSVTNTNPSINTAGLTLGQRKALEAGLRTMPESSGVQHADSGIRFNETGEASGSAVVQDAPPVYTAQ